MVGKEILEALAMPFADNEIEWRVQTTSKRNGKTSALMIPYIDARAAMKRLDETLGLGWKDDYTQLEINGIKSFQCAISINIDGEWITRTDGAELTDIESIKGGYSSAFKRTCVKFGIGRYLYDFPSVWCDVESRGRVQIRFKDSGQYTTGYVNPPTTEELFKRVNALKNKPNTTTKQPRNTNNYVQQQSRSNSPVQQQGNRPHQNNPNFEQEANNNGINAIANELAKAKVGTNLLPALFERMGSKSPKEANKETIKALYNRVKSVNGYLDFCRNTKLPLDLVLYYAKIVCKENISEIPGLFFFMTPQTCNEAIELAKGDLQKSHKVQ